MTAFDVAPLPYPDWSKPEGCVCEVIDTRRNPAYDRWLELELSARCAVHRTPEGLDEESRGVAFRLVSLGPDPAPSVSAGETGVIDSAVEFDGSLHLNVTWDGRGGGLNLISPVDVIELI